MIIIMHIPIPVPAYILMNKICEGFHPQFLHFGKDVDMGNCGFSLQLLFLLGKVSSDLLHIAQILDTKLVEAIYIRN